MGKIKMCLGCEEQNQKPEEGGMARVLQMETWPLNQQREGGREEENREGGKDVPGMSFQLNRDLIPPGHQRGGNRQKGEEEEEKSQKSGK
ncbi:hypothetical protein BTVI_18090 [Pitangus sulphuratus]|nr:hypothetical protein BTVI_18090 [Pitangus sulphuratus]